MQITKLIKSVTSIIFVGIFIIIVFNPMCGYVDGFAMESMMDNDAFDNNNNEREEVLNNWKKIFGISGQSTNESIRPKTPPQFMTELYNTIADPISGVTRGNNPHNAKIVRSFVEKGYNVSFETHSAISDLQDGSLPKFINETRLSHLYLFNIIGGVEINETVIEAELHLFRKRSDLKDIHPTILKSPYYLIRVYQVLEGQNMEVPDVHRLLNVHYVSAHASGWQVFNVKQAVLTWMTGVSNLGLMVTASTVFGDDVSIEFSRLDVYPNNNANKQPILVLFIDDGKVKDNEEANTKKNHGVPHYYTYSDDEDTNNDDREIEKQEENIEPEFPEDFHSGSTVDRRKREQNNVKIKEPTEDSSAIVNKELNKEFVDYGPQLGNKLSNGQTDLFKRQKRVRRDRKITKKILIQPENFVRRVRSTIHPKLLINDADDFVTQKKTRIERLRSMDIYERAMLREELEKKSDDETKREIRNNNYRRKLSKRWPRETGNDKETVNGYKSNNNVTECTLRDLYIDFDLIGLSNWIIAPKGYSAFHCRGSCDYYFSSGNYRKQTTKHAKVQAIVHKMGLVSDIDMPCCVPTKFLTAPILYYDDNDNVVLKVYEDIIADNCECQ